MHHKMSSTILNPFLFLTTLLFVVQFQSTDAQNKLPADPPKSSLASGRWNVLPFHTSVDEARNDALKRHNHYRALHGAPPLTLDPELTARVQHSAESHVKGLTTGEDGENLYTRSAWKQGPYYFHAGREAVRAVDGWYGQYCKGTTDPTEPGKGYFTRVVWNSSTQLGVGIAQSEQPSTKTRKVFVVARYLPLGNLEGQYDTEVGPLNVTDDKMCCRNKGMLCDSTGDSGGGGGGGWGGGSWGGGGGGSGGYPDKSRLKAQSGAETGWRLKIWHMVVGVASLFLGVVGIYDEDLNWPK